MKEDTASPQINVSKLVVGGGFVGAIFAAGSIAIFLIGVPILRVMFPAALVLGIAVALVFRFMRHKNPGAPWLLAAIEREPETPSNPEPQAKISGRSVRSPQPHRSVFLACRADCDLHILTERRQKIDQAANRKRSGPIPHQ